MTSRRGGGGGGLLVPSKKNFFWRYTTPPSGSQLAYTARATDIGSHRSKKKKEREWKEKEEKKNIPGETDFSSTCIGLLAVSADAVLVNIFLRCADLK